MAIRPYARDDDHAEDLLQECWQVILERLDRYGGRGSFAGWAIAVSKNVCRMHLRKAKRVDGRRTGLEDAGVPDSAPNPEEELVLLERRETVYLALGQLPDLERGAHVLRMLDGCEGSDTARSSSGRSSIAGPRATTILLSLQGSNYSWNTPLESGRWRPASTALSQNDLPTTRSMASGKRESETACPIPPQVESPDPRCQPWSLRRISEWSMKSGLKGT